MKNLRVAAGCCGIASAIAFLAEHPMKGLAFALCAVVLAAWSGLKQRRMPSAN